MKPKLLLLFTALTFITTSINAQFVWYENQTSTANITFADAFKGTFSTSETNPNTGGINTNATVSKFVRDGTASNQVLFDLPTHITSLAGLTITLKAYIDVDDPVIVNTRRIRVYLRNNAAATSTQIYLQYTMTAGKIWELATFDFGAYPDGATAISNAGGFFDRLSILTSAGLNDGIADVFYFDTITGAQQQTLSTNDLNKTENNFKLYPTNVTDRFETSKNVISADVYNIMGQKVKSFGAQKEFDATALSAGLYLFKAELDNGISQTIRFVKK